MINNIHNLDFNIKETRYNINSDINKIIADFENENKSILDLCENDGFVIGGKHKFLGELLLLDNLSGESGNSFCLNSKPIHLITNETKLFYRMFFRTNTPYVKLSKFSDVLSKIMGYFNVDKYTYLDMGVPGCNQVKSKKIPNQDTNISFLSLEININKKTILITYKNSKSQIKEITTEDEMKALLLPYNITLNEFDNALDDITNPIYQRIDKDVLKKIYKLNLKLINENS